MSSAKKFSDAQLIEQCNTGRRDDAIRAFETLYTRHRGYVQRVAFRYLGDRQLALDVLQDTFSYLLRKFPPTGDGLVLTAQLRSLLYTAAKNGALSLLRRNRRFDTADGMDPDSLPAEEPVDAEVGRLLHGLAPRQREVILLRYVDDLSLADIAAALEVPIGTVKSRLHGAILRLRKSPYAKHYFEK